MRHITLAIIADPTDQALAIALSTALTQAGVQTTALVGRPYDAPLRTEIFEAKVVALLTSPAAIASTDWHAAAEFAAYVVEHLEFHTTIMLVPQPID
nr:hypothetical protein [Ktedonobacterales bacterium]